MTSKLPFDICVVLVGLGAPTALYTELVANLRKQLTDIPVKIVNWWECEDYGAHLLDDAIQNRRTLLIAHSGGGVIAMQALTKYQVLIKRIIMLDTHALRNASTLSSVENMLKVLLNTSNNEVKEMVMKAYQPVLDDPTAFTSSLRYAIDWANTKLDATGAIIKSLPAHTVLHIGFTDSSYKILDAEHEKQQRDFWGQYNIDHQFILINHFDFVLPGCARELTGTIAKWLTATNLDSK